MRDLIISYFNDGLYTLDDLQEFIGAGISQEDYDQLAKSNNSNNSNN